MSRSVRGWNETAELRRGQYRDGRNLGRAEADAIGNAVAAAIASEGAFAIHKDAGLVLASP